MTLVKPKHKIKDSVFTNLFQDKNYLLQLYQTLHPEDTGAKTEVPSVISLTDEFFDGEEIAIEAKVKVFYQENETDIIGQYIIFCKVYNEQRAKYGNTMEAVTETIRICQNRNILKQYLQEKEQEVIDIMMTLFDDEQIMDAYVKEMMDEAGQKGELRGEKKTARNTAKQMLQRGKFTLDEILEYVPALSMEELKELEAEVYDLV